MTQRTKEFGIRLALGSTARQVFGLVLSEGMTVLGLGLGVGLVGAFSLRNAVASQLYDVETMDPIVLLSVMVVLGAIALLACVVPASRAMRVDPASSLVCKAPPVFLDTDLGENPMSKEVGKMVRSRDVVQAEGSARTEGARRATGVRADGAAAGAGSLAPGQRWSASRKRDVVLRLLRGESLEALSREAGVEIYRLDAWRERAMAGLELGLKDRHGEPVAEVLDAAKRHIGELSMEIELLRERARAAEQRLPLAMRRSRR